MTCARTTLPLAAALAALAGCGGDGGGASTSPSGGDPVAAARVEIENFTYRPAVATMRPGGTVTWTNRDSAPHTATTDRGQRFDTGTLRQGGSKRITVPRRPGTYSYHCTFHRFMVARVVVK